MNDRYSVLLVEDEIISRTIMEKHLRMAGYNVAVAENGYEAMEKLAREYYPVVITDMMMPVMDGLELCREVRGGNFPGYIYIIMVTVKDSKIDVVSGLEAGADEYLVKPVDKIELLARLNTAKRFLALENELKARIEEIRQLSITDELTGLFNRVYFYEHMSLEIMRAKRYGQDLALIMADIDHFKRINDTHGHVAGDAVLRGFGHFLKTSVREQVDWVVRFGGEEFIIVMPQTDVYGGYAMADRLCRAIATMPFAVNGTQQHYMSASFGVADLSDCMLKSSRATPDLFVELADTHLYEAKEGGRNRVVTRFTSCQV
jgi:two-component system, cell cycle response regulator